MQAERKHRSHEAEVQSYQHDWQQHVLRLKDYFERQGLQNVDPSGLHNHYGVHCSVLLLAPFGFECQPQAEHSSKACGYVVGLDLRASDVPSIVIDVGCSCMLSLHKASRPRDSSSKFSTTVRTAHVASVTSTVKTLMMTLAL